MRLRVGPDLEWKCDSIKGLYYRLYQSSFLRSVCFKPIRNIDRSSRVESSVSSRHTEDCNRFGHSCRTTDAAFLFVLGLVIGCKRCAQLRL